MNVMFRLRNRGEDSLEFYCPVCVDLSKDVQARLLHAYRCGDLERIEAVGDEICVLCGRQISTVDVQQRDLDTYITFTITVGVATQGAVSTFAGLLQLEDEIDAMDVEGVVVNALEEDLKGTIIYSASDYEMEPSADEDQTAILAEKALSSEKEG